jgi:hypothetical protein
MLRGYVVYILMFVALGVGLWAVLRFGATLQAPAEIAGQWDVRWETASPTGLGYHGTMRIDQSGRYCTLEFDDARTIAMKMVEGTALGRGDAKLPLARLSGGGYHVTLSPTAVREQLLVEIAGRGNHRGLAERVSRPSERAAAGGAGGAPPSVVPVADARH